MTEGTNTITVTDLILPDGRIPFAEWVGSLRDQRARLAIVGRLARVRGGNIGDYRGVGEGVFEMRIFYGPGYRLYFAHVGTQLIILLGGGDKSGQDRDIAAAQKIWKENKGDFEPDAA